jgi:hypothetical protein
MKNLCLPTAEKIILGMRENLKKLLFILGKLWRKNKFEDYRK